MDAKFSLWIIVAALSAILTLGNNADAQIPYPSIRTKPVKALPTDDELTALRKALFNERLAEMQGLCDHLQNRKLPKLPIINEAPFPDAARELVRAGLGIHQKAEDRLALLNDVLEMMENVVKLTEANLARQRPSAVHKARAVVLESKIEIAKIKKLAEKPKKS